MAHDNTDNPYSTPNSSLTRPVENKKLDKNKSVRRRKYAASFLNCMVVPVLMGFVMVLVYLIIMEPEISSNAFIVLLFGWMFSIPFALMTTLILFVLNRAGFKFTLVNSILVLPLVLTVIWLSGISLLYPPEDFMLEVMLLMGVPAFACGVRCAFIWNTDKKN